VAGAVAGLLILWFADLSWAGLLVVLALVGAFELAVYRIGARTGPPPTTKPRPTAETASGTA
jgi:hypothetical protein